MTAQERDQLRALIERRIEQLSTTRAAADESYQPRGLPSDDEAASLDSTINSTVTGQLKEQARVELRRLRHSLSWLDSDDAGYCSDCGDAIPLARLQAVPGSQRCVGCSAQQGEQPQ